MKLTIGKLTLGSLTLGFCLGLISCAQPQPVAYVQPVQQQPIVVQQPAQVIYQPYYDPTLILAYDLFGHPGYYDHTHTFHTTIVVNGASGYRDSAGRFVSADRAVKVAAASGRPIYGTPAGSIRSASNPSGLNGSMGRSSAPAAPQASRPVYGSPAAPQSRPVVTQRRPTFGSSSAPASRPSSSSSSRPSFGSRR